MLRRFLVLMLPGVCLSLAGADARAALSYYVSIDGNAETRVATNAGAIDDKPTISTGQLAQSVYSDSRSSSQDGVDGTVNVYHEHAETVVTATSTIGALHATISATGTTSPNWGPGAAYANGSLNLEWFDTVTFHTSNPGGADFTAALILDDTITPTLLAPAGYHSAGGFANAILDINGGTYAQIYDAVTAGSAPNHPPSNIQLVSLHVTDGMTKTFRVRLQVGGSATDAASLEAGNTALFALYTSDSAASYTTASGVTFVPEPASFSLLALAFSLLGRRKSRGFN